MAGHKFEKVAVIGVGLIGGSIALDAKEAGWFGKVTGCGRSAENLKTAKDMGIIDDFTHDPAEAVRDADLVILATPVASFVKLAEKIAHSLKKGAIVTDVGSVKGRMVEKLEAALGSEARFVAGHPVAGSEKFGAKAAIKGLFRGKRCVLTVTSGTDPEAVKLVQGLWEAVGMKVVKMDPFRHDLLLAATSHLPHMVAYALVDTVLRLKENEPDVLDFAAGGFHDFTRIAASSAEMWRDIFLLNSDAIIEVLDIFEQAAKDLREMIIRRDGDAMLRLFEKSRAARGSGTPK